MLLTFLLIIILFIVIAIFSFPQFSPIPYFPSNKKDLPLIIKAFKLKNNQTVIDLGAGDGIVIFEAAKEAFRKKLNTKFIAVEINPVLICILYIRRFLHPNRGNIKVMYGNMFKLNIKDQISKIKNTYQKSKIKNSGTIEQSNNITFYLYISPWYFEKVIKDLKLKIKNFKIVSYMYPIKSLKSKVQITQGKNKIYKYQFLRSI